MCLRMPGRIEFAFPTHGPQKIPPIPRILNEFLLSDVHSEFYPKDSMLPPTSLLSKYFAFHLDKLQLDCSRNCSRFSRTIFPNVTSSSERRNVEIAILLGITSFLFIFSAFFIIVLHFQTLLFLETMMLLNLLSVNAGSCKVIRK